MSDLRHVVVVGASLAGLRACEALRGDGFGGTVSLVGAETHRPYDRPPLSKKVLAGEWEPERIALRQPDRFDELGLDLHLGVAATALDAERRAVTLADGTVLDGDAVIVATGSRPRRLSGQPPGVHVLRTLDDAVGLRDELVEGSRLVIVGAGFIGLEVAATAVARDVGVTVLEGLGAPLVRGVGAELGWAASRPLIERGIDLRCEVRVETVDPTGVTLVGGERVPADAVLVGVGVDPVTDWLDTSGLELRDGVVADETLRAAPGVYVAGDIARWRHGGSGEELRIEHWTNAADQGAAAAKNLLAHAQGGAGTPFAPVPFVWSDQGRHRIQVLGRPASDGDEVVVAVGDTSEPAFVALVRRGDRLRGAIGVNAPKALMAYQRLLSEGAAWPDALALAATQTVPLPRPGS
ncbi:MAG: NAD(P)/FAD-dependent oxidoreductase [Desertimonas sp.]